MKRPITSNETESAIKLKKKKQKQKTPNKVQDHIASHWNSTKHLRMNWHLSLSNSSKKLKRKEHFQTHYLNPGLHWYQTQRHYKKGNSVQFSSVAQLCPTLCDPMNRSMPGLPVQSQANKSEKYRCKDPRQNIRKQNSTAYKKNLMPWSNGISPKSANLVQYLKINHCDTPH